jgi:hypothetical protein
MIVNTTKKILSTGLCWMLIALGVPREPAMAQDQPTGGTASQPPSAPAGPTVAPQSAEQLDALVAPIALYPDALVAQVLGAATFPDQVAIADYWLGQNKNLTGTALAQAVDKQPWDPSVKALTQFPDVLDDLAHNLAWASSLGEAFHNQQADVMAAVQVMRAKAQAAGTLKSTPQVKVIQQAPQTIVIQPANPQVVYVPQYNPTLVYGVPYVVPLYRPRVAVAAAVVSFGAGIAIGAAFGGGGFIGGGFGFGWGWHAWNCNWGGGGGGNIVFNHNTYISNNSWHGGNTYNGYHPWGPGSRGAGPHGPHPYGPNGGGGYRPQPNGGRNGDHGLIGGNGGVEHRGADGDRINGGDRGRSQMSRDGWGSRAESNRGRSSMHPEMRQANMHQPRMNRGGGGGGGRRRR